MPRRLLSLLACLLALALLAAGCGGDDGDDEGDAGKGLSGSGYSVEVPRGWKDRTDRADELGFAGFKPDVVLIGPREQGFQPSINVVIESSLASDVSLDDYVEAGRAVLERGSVGGEDIPGEDVEVGRVREATLGGEQASGFEHTRTIAGRRLRARQLIALRNGSAYTVTYTALADRFEQDLSALEQFLVTWRWR